MYDNNIAFVLLLGIIISLGIGPKIFSCFPHSGWKYNATPDVNAVITNVETIKEKVAKNDVKYKTIVQFSDGFYYYSYDTNRTNHTFSYTISIDGSMHNAIIDAAKEKHAHAVRKNWIIKDPTPGVAILLSFIRLILFVVAVVYIFRASYRI